ncbi:MAG: response regulator [Candidatus Latescibacteria bacterium]|nr:response regulator [Candidatus Latescibacterota bacterium]
MAESAEKKRSRGVQILLVDNESDFVEVYADILRAWNYTVTTTTSAAQAIQLVEGADFDLVITDIWMPGMNGIDLLKTLKQMRSTLPVIVITGYSSVQTAIQAMKAEAADYLIKSQFLESKARECIERTLMNREIEPKRKGKTDQNRGDAREQG